ncbi:DUF4169 family protein [Phaeovulum sp.]|uniref:DUF4169 family protein n=1 Tax=Phaeovulum sp. TaxID=2934796 RepID=UPI00272FB3F0|nr:DUF4169 family protein [Phaeovulum sp.]MDP1669584.1 DUF4169 family protein [Phaeovulum sp.]MDZ4119089.1 DUF4169 family protein [Phaeovulum sp.]
MAEVVNLRTAKKRIARAKDAAQGESNAVKFGRTKAEVRLAKAEAARAKAALDGHRRDP